MAIPFAALAAIQATTAAIGAGINYAQAKRQQKMANAINPIDPGVNTALQDNASLLEDRYTNYTMPGFSRARGDIGLGAATALSSVQRGATSSNDILDAATRIAYGSNQAMNDLYTQNAQGQDAAMMDYLNANAAAGADKIAWERQRYLQDMQRKAELTNASIINKHNAINQGLAGISSAATTFAKRPGDEEEVVEEATTSGLNRMPIPVGAAQYAALPATQPTRINPFLKTTPVPNVGRASYAGVNVSPAIARRYF